MTVQLGLGTAQFGSRYGVTNRTGQVVEAEAAAILHSAAKSGVVFLDTAYLYGTAQSVIGRVLPRPNPFQIITKSLSFDGGPIALADVSRARAALESSLKALRVDQVYGYLVHHAEDLLCTGGDRLFEALRSWKDEGLCSRIGVSAYSGDQVDALLDRYDLDLVQMPLSILDQRPLRNGVLDRLVAAGVEVHARSLFLQGVALARAGDLPRHFTKFRASIDRLDQAAMGRADSRLNLALAFIKNVIGVDAAIIGVASCDQFQEIVDAWNGPSPDLDYSVFGSDDEDFVDPSRWPRFDATRDGPVSG
ncbi:MAG: aldo/keto reductase [Alphaproteobacteria bacterium]|nr:aldo/keto reductase [Alphaproteobacteria bacterium]